MVTVIGRGFTPNLLFCDVYSDFRKRSGGMILVQKSSVFCDLRYDIQQKSACMIYVCMLLEFQECEGVVRIVYEALCSILKI